MNSIILDMDGTIADLYSVNDWLKWLKHEDVKPYRDCEPIIDMSELASVITLAQAHGIACKVVSWGARGSSLDYLKNVAKAKREWLKRYLPCELDAVHVTRYGTNKNRYAKKGSVLVDDNAMILSAWDKGQIIDAKQKDWLKMLKKLVDEAVSTW